MLTTQFHVFMKKLVLLVFISFALNYTANAACKANVARDTTICSGNSVNIGKTAISGHTYSWTSNPAGYSNSSANPSVSPTSTTTFILVEVVSGCTSTDSVKVTVNSAPIAPYLFSNTPICEGDSLKLAATIITGVTYSWKGPNSFSDTARKPHIANVVIADSGLYTCTVNNGTCTNSTNINCVIYRTPKASITGTVSVCSKGYYTYTAGDTGHTYKWIVSGGYIASGYWTNSISVKWDTAGTGYVRLVEWNKRGCTDSTTLSITINKKPAAITGTYTGVCSGSHILLGGKSVSGNTYTWTSKPSGFTSSISDPIDSPVNTGTSSIFITYYLTEKTTATGCSANDSVTYRIIAGPKDSIIASTSICDGQSINIGGGAVSGIKYSWTSNPSGFISNNNNPAVSPSSATTYYLTETDNKTKCTAKDSVTISVNPKPSASLGKTSALCEGSSASYSTATNSGDTYTWTVLNGKITSGKGTNSINVNWTGTGSGNVQVIETNISGCTDTASATIVLNPLPTPSISGSTNVCVNGNNVYVTGKNSGSVFHWAISGGSVASGKGTDSVLVNWGSKGKGLCKVVEITIAGCTDSSSANVVINSLPTPKVSGPTEGCANATLGYITANNTGSSYNWTLSNGTISFGAASDSAAIQLGSMGTAAIQVVETNANGCSDSSNMTIKINPLPDANWTMKNLGKDKYAFMAHDTLLSAYAYNWSFGDGNSGSGFNPIHKYLSSNSFFVQLQVTDGKNCTNSKDSSLSIITGISAFNSDIFGVNVYPNPFKDEAMIEYNLPTTNSVKISIFTLDGKSIYTSEESAQKAGKYEIPFTGNTNSVYILQMILDNNVVTKRIVKVR